MPLLGVAGVTVVLPELPGVLGVVGVTVVLPELPGVLVVPPPGSSPWIPERMPRLSGVMVTPKRSITSA